MKYELKIELKDLELFSQFINSAYKNGTLYDKTKKLTFDKGSNTHTLCKGLSNLAVRLYNEEIIDGTIRLIVSETEEGVDLYPCSLYYEVENNKYSFSI